MTYKTLKYYSTTAASNATINGTNYFPEGQAPSTVNDAARQFMADLASFYQSMYATFQARLTLTSGTAVTTSDVTGAGTIYLTPYKGDQIWLYDGSTQWNLFNLTEISLALTLTSGKPYDVFVYDNSGTPTLEVLVWTNDTTRATGLVLQNGILVKSGATTRRYVGTIYSSGANTTEDSVTKRYVWNYYNRINRNLRNKFSADRSTTSTSYTEVNTEIRCQFVIGVSEDVVHAAISGSAFNSSVNVSVHNAVAFDSTSTPEPGIATCMNAPSGDTASNTSCTGWKDGLAVGFHYATLLGVVESGTGTWYQTTSVKHENTYLHVRVKG